ncbi:hypothetical protein BJX99DRAFT_263827 [Aspergillus californicus]
MKSTAVLSLSLLGALSGAIAVQLEITEVRWLNGNPSRTQIVDIPYTNTSLLPKDQPCPALPYLTREVKLLTENLTVPTRCGIQECHNFLEYVTMDNPDIDLINSAFAVRCYELE